MTLRKIIAICGPKNSGKSTLGKLLTTVQTGPISGAIRIPFAQTLKSMLIDFLRLQGVDFLEIDRMLTGDLKEIPTIYFDGQTPRRAMQTLGTEWRDLISKDLWINAWERAINKYPNNTIIVDDLRFLHEAERIRKLGGHIIMIHRENINGSTDLHQSEREYLRIDHDLVVVNDMAPADMLKQVLAHFPNLI